MEKLPTNKQSLTRALNLPLTKFKKPSRQNQSASEEPAQLGIELKNGQVIPIDLHQPAILGRHIVDADGVTKIDLSQTGELDNGVSRSHAILHMIEGVIYVTDDNSLNGSYLNGAELYPMRNYVLNDGDTLRLGKVELRVLFMS